MRWPTEVRSEGAKAEIKRVRVQHLTCLEALRVNAEAASHSYHMLNGIDLEWSHTSTTVRVILNDDASPSVIDLAQI